MFKKSSSSGGTPQQQHSSSSSLWRSVGVTEKEADSSLFWNPYSRPMTGLSSVDGGTSSAWNSRPVSGRPVLEPNDEDDHCEDVAVMASSRAAQLPLPQPVTRMSSADTRASTTSHDLKVPPITAASQRSSTHKELRLADIYLAERTLLPPKDIHVGVGISAQEMDTLFRVRSAKADPAKMNTNKNNHNSPVVWHPLTYEAATRGDRVIIVRGSNNTK